ncbi:msl9601 (plasmid) [Mesorhizobium japonicum MAFF 303099]|uniref:Msl9601 protein n=1 Tax=Mesorhizobium japonicum (strain LMG 29417 / CECT 9101 / MAFF 303099) TaxID=266835 RepID=Q98P59_RHILO|nr:msl9601 [Mesorhizobium japonicum MAFF 303099]
MERRQAIRRVSDGLWEVYDIDNNKVVRVGGVLLTNLLDEDALDALDLIRDGFLTPGQARRTKA